MNWDAISAFGEVAGAIGVIVTLVYLARQISQNSATMERTNQYAHAQSVHDTNTQFSAVFAQLASDRELATIYSKALKNEPLDDPEFVRFAAFVSMYFAWFQDVHNQTRLELGYQEILGSNALKAGIEILGPYIKRLLETQSGQRWWREEAPYQYESGFLAIIETLT